MEKLLKFSGFEQMYETYGFVFEANSVIPKPSKPEESVMDPKTGLAKEKITDMLSAFGGSKKGKKPLKPGAVPAPAKPKVLEDEDDDIYEDEDELDEDYDTYDDLDEEDFNFSIDLDHDLIEEADEPKSKLYLKLGDKGPIVSKVKAALDLDSKTDVFDKELEQEVIDFKKDEKFKKADGVVGAFAYQKMLMAKGLRRRKLRKAVAEFVKGIAALKTPKKQGAAGAGKKFVKLNDKGEAVKKVQSALDLNPSGTFDKEMEQEVMDFKKDMKFKKVDGLVGPVTYQKMLIDKGVKRGKLKKAVAEFVKLLGNPKSGAKTAAVVKPGSKGEPVKILQNLIGAKPTGVFDKESEAKLKAFQAKYGIKPTNQIGQEGIKQMLIKKGIKGESLKKAQDIYVKSPDGKKIAGKTPNEAFSKYLAIKGGKKTQGGILKSGALYGVFDTMTIINVNGAQYVVALPRKDAAAKLTILKKRKNFAKRYGWIALAEKAAGKALIYTTEGVALATVPTANAMNNIAISSYKYAKPGTMACVSSVAHGLAQVQKWNAKGLSKKLSTASLNAGALWTGYITSCSQALKGSAQGMYTLLCSMRASLAPAGKAGEVASNLALNILKPLGKSLGLNWEKAKNTAEAKIIASKALNAKDKAASKKILSQIITNHKTVKTNSIKGGQASVNVISKFSGSAKAGISSALKSTNLYLTNLAKWTTIKGTKKGVKPVAKPGAAPAAKPGAAPVAKPGAAPAAKPAAPSAAAKPAAPASTPTTKGKAVNPNLTARR
jgi:peptidoglycan hydrolase-like protein with peptidoglycan-binding domain